mgnify:CR=1 FL=1
MKRTVWMMVAVGIVLLGLAACGSAAPESPDESVLFAANGPALTVVEKQPDQYTTDPEDKTVPPEQSPDLLTMNSQEEEGFALVYPESELTGLEGTLTTFRIAPDRITLLREGTINSEMIFEEGQKHSSLYETPFGGLMLGVNTDRAKARIGEGGGSLSIRYALEADSQLIGENAFEIQVTEPTLDQRAPLDQAL